MAPPMKRVVFGEYSTVLPTVPAGETHALQCDSNAVLLVKLAAGGASTTVRVATPSAYATSALAKEEAIYGSGGGKLAAVYAINNSGALKYLQLFDATSTPGAVVPLVSIAVPPGGNGWGSWVDGLDLFAAGIWWSCSTTAAVHTQSATDDLLVHAQYYTS